MDETIKGLLEKLTKLTKRIVELEDKFNKKNIYLEGYLPEYGKDKKVNIGKNLGHAYSSCLPPAKEIIKGEN